jgi:hypothetical protein
MKKFACVPLGDPRHNDRLRSDTWRSFSQGGGGAANARD